MSTPTGRAAAGGSAPRPASQVPPPSNSTVVAFFLVIVLIGAGLGVGGTLGWQWYNRTFNQPISVEYPQHPSYVSPDGNVLLNGDLPPDSTVSAEYDQNRSGASVNSNPQLAFKALTVPVNITIYGGDKKPANDQIDPDTVTVTLKYNPALIPKGLTPLQVGMVVYDEHLQSWVPILNAKADPRTNTVTARAPHFSWFDAIVLDPAKSLVTIVGQKIQTTIDSLTSVGSWLVQVTDKVTTLLINDLTGTPPDLKCDNTSPNISVSLSSPLDKLKGCVQTAASLDRIKISNGFAFPLISDKLPQGLTLTMNDVWDDGANLQDAVRTLFWTNQRRLYISGASIASVTATGELQGQVTTKVDLDSDALAFDMGIAALLVMAPESTGPKLAIKALMEKVVSGATVSREAIQQASGWAAQAYDLSNCVFSSAHDINQPYDDSGVEAAAGIVHDCLGNILDGLNLKGALADLLSNLKLIPGTIQSALYGTSAALLDQLPAQFDSIKVKTPTMTVTRIGAAKQPAPGKDNQSKPAPATDTGNWGNYKSLIGTWKAGNMTLVIQDGAVGTFTWDPAACPNSPGSSEFTWCVIKGGLSFMPSAKSTVWFHARSATKKQGGSPMALIPEVGQRIQEFGGYVTRASDGRSIIIELPARPGTHLEFCDTSLFQLSQNAGSPYRARCSGDAVG